MLNKNKNRQTGIPHRQAQSCRMHHTSRILIYHKIKPSSKNGGGMGPQTSTFLAQTGITYLYEIPPLVQRRRSINKQYSVYCPDSPTLTRRLKNLHQGIQWQRPCMSMENTTRITQRLHSKLTRITGIRNINLPFHPKNGTRVIYLYPSQKVTLPQDGCKMNHLTQ